MSRGLNAARKPIKSSVVRGANGSLVYSSRYTSRALAGSYAIFVNPPSTFGLGLFGVLLSADRSGLAEKNPGFGSVWIRLHRGSDGLHVVEIVDRSIADKGGRKRQ